jgi:glycerophosphoryl diester phosphodiesterase
MLSADGVPLVHHDLDLQRIAGRPAKVADLPYDEIATLDAGRHFDSAFAGQRIPRFADMIALLGELGLGANVEIKPGEGQEAETARVALDTIGRLWPDHLPTPLISSFKPDALAAARDAAPAVPRGYLANTLDADWRVDVAALGCATVHLWGEKLTEEVVRAVKGAGYGLAVFTVNDGASARRFVDWGVDAIITDVPDTIIAALDPRQDG